MIHHNKNRHKISFIYCSFFLIIIVVLSACQSIGAFNEKDSEGSTVDEGTIYVETDHSTLTFEVMVKEEEKLKTYIDKRKLEEEAKVKAEAKAKEEAAAKKEKKLKEEEKKEHQEQQKKQEKKKNNKQNDQLVDQKMAPQEKPKEKQKKKEEKPKVEEPKEKPKKEPKKDTPPAEKSFVDQVIDLTNTERKKAGLSPLQKDSALMKMAQAKSRDMRENGEMSHESPKYGGLEGLLNTFNVSYTMAAENIAWNQKNPSEVVNSWMNSSGHKANMLNGSYTHIGVGYDGGYWTQHFTRK